MSWLVPLPFHGDNVRRATLVCLQWLVFKNLDYKNTVPWARPHSLSCLGLVSLQSIHVSCHVVHACMSFFQSVSYARMVHALAIAVSLLLAYTCDVYHGQRRVFVLELRAQSCFLVFCFAETSSPCIGITVANVRVLTRIVLVFAALNRDTCLCTL